MVKANIVLPDSLLANAAKSKDGHAMQGGPLRVIILN